MDSFKIYLEQLAASMRVQRDMIESAAASALTRNMPEISGHLVLAAESVRVAVCNAYAAADLLHISVQTFATAEKLNAEQPTTQSLPETALTDEERKSNGPDEVPSHKQIG